MRNPGEIWRQRLWVWLPALLFFLANAAAFSVYRFGYAGRVETLDERLHAQETEMKRLAAKRKEVETLVARVRTNNLQVQQLYSERLSTRSRRLTGITAEIKDVAAKAGLRPRAISYPEEEIEEHGLVKRSFSFTVEGTYSELRKFLNLLELSPSFLTVDEIALAGGGEEGPELRMDMTISTLFAKNPGAAVEPRPAAVAGAADGADRSPS
jgi:Tfp pilus assembly protein PilO